MEDTASLDSSRIRLTKIVQLQKLSRNKRNQVVNTKEAISLLEECNWNVKRAFIRLLDDDKEPAAKKEPSKKRNESHDRKTSRKSERLPASSRARSRRSGMEEEDDESTSNPMKGDSAASLNYSPEPTLLECESKKKKEQSSKRKKSLQKPKRHECTRSSRHEDEGDMKHDSSVKSEQGCKAESVLEDTPVLVSSNLDQDDLESGTTLETDEINAKEDFFSNEDSTTERNGSTPTTQAAVSTETNTVDTHNPTASVPASTTPGVVDIPGPDGTPGDDEYTLAPTTSNSSSPAIVTAHLVEHDDDYYMHLQRRNQELEDENRRIRQAPVAQVQVERCNRRRVLLALLAVVLVVVTIATILGVVLPSPQADACTFCFGGTTPTNLLTNSIGSQTCLSFMQEQLALGLNAEDSECKTAQALAWRHCECPALPPKDRDSTCNVCKEVGKFPVGAECSNFDSFLSHVDHSEGPSCEETISNENCACRYPIDLLPFLSSVSFDGGAALQSHGTPQNNAYEWLAGEANLEWYNDERKTIQRYVLATLYYSTNGDSWGDNSGWLSDDDECSWYNRADDSFCSNGAVVEVDLWTNNLVGTIPAELGLLSIVDKVNLPGNSLTGTIPTEIGLMTNLKELYLYRNSLTGTIPSEIALMTSLSVLSLDDNSFTGEFTCPGFIRYCEISCDNSFSDACRSL